MAISDIVVLSIGIMWLENDIAQAEQLPSRTEVEFYGVFGDTIRIFWLGHQISVHQWLVGTIHGNRRSKDNASAPVFDGSIDQVCAACRVVLVVETPDKVRQCLCGIGGQVTNIVEPVILK